MSEIEQEDLDFADADALVKEMRDGLIIYGGTGRKNIKSRRT